MSIQGLGDLKFNRVNEKLDLITCLRGLIGDAKKVQDYAQFAYEAKDEKGYQEEKEKFVSLCDQIDAHFNYYLDAKLPVEPRDQELFTFATKYARDETVDRMLDQGFELTGDLLFSMIKHRTSLFIHYVPRLHSLGLSQEVKDKLLTEILLKEEISWEKRKELTKEMIQLGCSVQNPRIPFLAVIKNDPEFLEFFIDQGGDFSRSDSPGHPLLIYNLYRRYVKPDRESEKIQDLLLNSDAIFVSSFFWSASLNTLKTILPYLGDPQEIVSKIFFNRGREDVLPLLAEAGLFASLDEKRQSELLRMGISNLQTEKVKFLIEKQGWKIKDEHIKAALESCHLEMIDCLQLRETFKAYLLSQKDKIGSLIENLLFYSPDLVQTREFLNSLKNETPELKNVIEQTEERVIRLIPLCARWTLLHEKKEIFLAYKGIPDPTPEQLSTFVQEQLKYAERCWKSIQAMQEEGAAETLKDQILFFSKKRVEIASENRGVQQDDPFSRFRQNIPSRIYGTPMTAYFPYSSRYDFVISEVRGVQSSGVKGFEPNPDGGYNLTYPDPQTGEPLVLTTITLLQIEGSRFFEWKWQNCSGERAYQLWPHLEKMHTTLSTMKVDPENQEEVEAFHALLAEAYWLGCHLNITVRGNAQYFLNWLYDQRTSHGLPPLIPKTQYPLPDCVAMTLPLETFKARFLTFFESQE